jgi:hypothetical protein
MQNISPPLHRSECERMIRAALSIKAAPEPVQGDSVFVVGYHCRDANGLATLNWLPHDNAVPLMTVDQHNRITASATNKLDTKGSRKALGAMNAKLRAKVGRLERELAAAKPDAELVERVAKAIYEQWSGNPHYRPWVDGGNSFKQDDCRALARKACSIDAKLASLRKGEA